VPAIVKAADPAKARKRADNKPDAAKPVPPANADRKPAIVTIRRKPERVLPPGLLPETPEEHKRRGDGADAMFQEMKRQIAREARRNRP
jgi:hypothetical protein